MPTQPRAAEISRLARRRKVGDDIVDREQSVENAVLQVLMHGIDVPVHSHCGGELVVLITKPSSSQIDAIKRRRTFVTNSY